GRGTGQLPFDLLETVFLELDVHLHALDRPRDLIADPYLGVVEVVGGLKDLHKTFVHIDAFTQTGVFGDDLAIESRLFCHVHIGFYRLAPGEDVLDRIIEFAVGDRLEHVVFYIDTIFLCLGGSQLFCSEHQHRDLLGIRVLLDPFEGLPAVHGFHHDVEEDQVWGHGLEDLEAFLAPVRGNSPVSATFEHGNKNIDDERAVVNHKDRIHYIASPIFLAT